MKKLNIFKIAALTAVFAFAGMFANAQVANTVQPETALGATAGSVKVIDNKGTVKYLQSQNGITMFTNTAPSGGVVTTWKLGGTLTDDTYIDVAGKEFGIKQLQQTLSGTSYEMVVIDADGNLKRLDFAGLIQKGHQIFPVTADNLTGGMALVLTATTTTNPLPSYETVYVYRNGAKLEATTDYSVTATQITVNPTFPLYDGDRIEVHYVK